MKYQKPEIIVYETEELMTITASAREPEYVCSAAYTGLSCYGAGGGIWCISGISCSAGALGVSCGAGAIGIKYINPEDYF